MRLLPLLMLLLAAPLWAREPLRVAVAANFRATLESINAGFEARTGESVLLSSASTGVLHTQILHGAPFHLFFAADDRSPRQLQDAGIGRDSFCYASGILTLVGNHNGLQALAIPSQSLAIANPATAPYGRAAAEVLAREAFRPGEGRKLVQGNNVAQAYQFWHSGAVNMALVAKPLVADDGIDIPAAWHAPLHQHALVLRGHPALDAYLNWIRSDTVRSQILDAGYRPCP